MRWIVTGPTGLTRAEINALLNAAASALAGDEGGDFGCGRAYARKMIAMRSAMGKLHDYLRDRGQVQRLLRDASGALSDELDVSTVDEIRQHPTLRAHQRVYNQIEKYLAAGPKEQL